MLNLLRSGPEIGKIWGFCSLICSRGHLRGSPIAKVFLLKLEPRYVAEFRKFRFKNVEKSGSGKKNKNHPQNIMVFAIASTIAGDHNKYIRMAIAMTCV